MAKLWDSALLASHALTQRKWAASDRKWLVQVKSLPAKMLTRRATRLQEDAEVNKGSERKEREDFGTTAKTLLALASISHEFTESVGSANPVPPTHPLV